MRSGSSPAADAPLGRSPEERDRILAELDELAAWLDSRWRIPGTRIRFGLDSVLGLVPGIGDLAATGPALYLVWRAHDIGVPRRVIARMLANVGFDTVAGSVPLLGNIFDLFFKASRRNHALLRDHVSRW